MSSGLLVVLLTALLTGALSALVPSVVGRLPEPEPALGADGAPSRAHDPLAPADAKPPYAVLGAARGLGAWSVLLGALAGAVCAAAAIGLDKPGLLPSLVMLVPLGVALGYVDARTRLLPSALIKPAYPALVALLVVGAAIDGSWRLLLAAAVGWLVYGGLFLVLNLVYPAGLGYGDVRLAGLLGLVLGYAGLAPLLVGLEASFVLGALGGLVLVVVRRVRRRPASRGYPFGPFMLVGTLVGLTLGEPLLRTLMGGGSP